jgi:hypothetical protein
MCTTGNVEKILPYEEEREERMRIKTERRKITG